MRRRHWIAVTVLLLVGLTFGVLLPAISRLREASASMKCTGNLKQLSLALHSASDSRDRRFPSGTVPIDFLDPERRLSWYVTILPFIEQSSVYRQFNREVAVDDQRNGDAIANRFPQSVCPATDEYRSVIRGGKWNSPTPLANYIGVAGVGADAATLPLGNPRAGVFGYDRRTSIEDGMPDGSSNTLLLIETAREPGHWAFGGRATVHGVELGTYPYIGPGRPFGGLHDGGWVWRGNRRHVCNVAMADGSTRAFIDTTAPEILEALATVGGKEQIHAEW